MNFSALRSCIIEASSVNEMFAAFRTYRIEYRYPCSAEFTEFWGVFPRRTGDALQGIGIVHCIDDPLSALVAELEMLLSLRIPCKLRFSRRICFTVYFCCTHQSFAQIAEKLVLSSAENCDDLVMRSFLLWHMVIILLSTEVMNSHTQITKQPVFLTNFTLCDIIRIGGDFRIRWRASGNMTDNSVMGFPLSFSDSKTYTLLRIPCKYNYNDFRSFVPTRTDSNG